MPIHTMGLVTGLLVAKSNNLTGPEATRVALLPAIMGFTPLSLVLTSVVARRQSENQAPPPAVVVQKITMPNVMYMPVDKARELIKKAGLTDVTVVLMIPSNELAKGVVIEQVPPAGETVAPDASVELCIGIQPSGTDNQNGNSSEPVDSSGNQTGGTGNQDPLSAGNPPVPDKQPQIQ